nr:hypothetical protein [Tanacetum cinerariifolium]
MQLGHHLVEMMELQDLNLVGETQLVVLHKIVSVVEENRIVELSMKAIVDNEKDYIEIGGCFDRK